VLPWPGAKSFVARVVAIAAVVLAGVLALSAPAAALVTPFREVAVVEGALYVGSDGVRFVWATNEQHEVVRVFDTLRGRSFELTAPRPGCSFEAIGSGIAVWGCFPSKTKLLTSLATGRSRKAEGSERLGFCGSDSIGRHWLEFNYCNTGGHGVADRHPLGSTIAPAALPGASSSRMSCSRPTRRSSISITPICFARTARLSPGGRITGRRTTWTMRRRLHSSQTSGTGTTGSA
jgi:hypothetical protein